MKIITGSKANDTDLCPFGDDVQKYWDNRTAYFDKFHSGIQIDKEGLYSVTPQEISNDIATKISGAVVLDAFAGVGGNTIAFAKAGKKVIAVESNRQRLEIAKNNALIYEVSNMIEFVHDDILNVLELIDYNSVYLDPPWGGPKYRQNGKFTLSSFDPNGAGLITTASKKCDEVVIKIPKNFISNELDVWRNKILNEYLNGRHVFSTAYLDVSSELK